jgi:hypothetical protein
MATSEPGKFCQMAASLLPKEMHIKDVPLKIREVRHVIVGAIKAGDKRLSMTKPQQSSIWALPTRRARNMPM